MNGTNKEFANQLLFEDPETGEELCPSKAIEVSEDGTYKLYVENSCGTRRWLYTLKIEEVWEEWTAYKENEKVFVGTNDFETDARLELSGDFITPEHKLSYAKDLAKRLNK